MTYTEERDVSRLAQFSNWLRRYLLYTGCSRLPLRLLTALEERDRHRGYLFLYWLRMCLKYTINSKIPLWMPGTRILLRQIADQIYKAEQKIEHKIWKRRWNAYHEERWEARLHAIRYRKIGEYAYAKVAADKLMAGSF